MIKLAESTKLKTVDLMVALEQKLYQAHPETLSFLSVFPSYENLTVVGIMFNARNTELKKIYSHVILLNVSIYIQNGVCISSFLVDVCVK